MRRLLPALAALTCAVIATPSQAGTYRQVYTFQGGADGAVPAAGVIDEAGLLYGTTIGGGAADGGTVFALDPSTGANKILHSFGASGDGSMPHAGLLNVGGTLYGAAAFGGVGQGGTLFAVDPGTGAERTVSSFKYGRRTKFEYFPMVSLIQIYGKLYGTTADTPALHAHLGSVFSFDPSMTVKKFLYYFKGGSDGAFPLGSLLDIGGTLYGTTAGGGGAADCSIHCGTVFSMDRKTGAETIVYGFQGGADGHKPVAGLIYAEGFLYGTTQYGGAPRNCSRGCGTVFSINLATGAEKIIHSFGGGDDGAYPRASLVKLGGRLYGTTSNGGHSKACDGGCGTVFSLDASTGDERVDYAFQGGTDGAAPFANLTNVGGTLYGTTESGGADNTNCRIYDGTCGTVFAYTP